MPACTNESLSQLWKKDFGNGNLSTSPPSAYSPPPQSPTPRLRRIPSALNLAQVSRTLTPSPTPPPEPEPRGFFRWIIFICLRLIKNFLVATLNLVWSQILIGPTLWITVWLWLFWKSISLPLNFIKWILIMVFTTRTERSRKKRTVLISSGSSVQSLHLARNFYSAGARVVVCEIDGHFSLSRFSTAVERSYTIPSPSLDHPEEYIQALCSIVKKENVLYYIPVSETNAAYFDALAKPHLEALMCTVFCPTLKEVKCFDDQFEILGRCRNASLPTPVYYHVKSRDDMRRLYDTGMLRSGRHFMVNTGISGITDRVKIQLPPFRQDFRISQEISENKPWLIVQDLQGEHYVTCTTVKDSKVVANVSCFVERDRGGLIPVDKEEITHWIQMLLNKLKYKNIDGHFSFRFVITGSGSIVPLGCRVGVSLPYLCLTKVHPRMVWKPCPHFSRRNSGPLVADTPRYWMHDAVLTTLRHPSMEAVVRFIGTVLDKREALFVYWDPLPYCAYYHVQLPVRNILQFLRGNRMNRPHIRRSLTAPVQ